MRHLSKHVDIALMVMVYHINPKSGKFVKLFN